MKVEVKQVLEFKEFFDIFNDTLQNKKRILFFKQSIFTNRRNSDSNILLLDGFNKIKTRKSLSEKMLISSDLIVCYSTLEKKRILKKAKFFLSSLEKKFFVYTHFFLDEQKNVKEMFSSFLKILEKYWKDFYFKQEMNIINLSIDFLKKESNFVIGQEFSLPILVLQEMVYLQTLCYFKKEVKFI